MVPSEVFILTLNFRPDEVDDAHLEAFINSAHLEKLLPARTLYPDLAYQLDAVLEDRSVLWMDNLVTQEWDDYGTVESLYFLSTAEVLVKAWKFMWCATYR
ncbi:hypothetical protein JCM10296v2_002112 [Rhodotorula toruloides]